MKYSIDMVLSDIRKLLEHVSGCTNGNSYDFIAVQYRKIIEHTPFEWYFCDGLSFEDVDHGYDSIQTGLELLESRLEYAKRHTVFQMEAFFDNIKDKIIREIKNTNTSISVAVAWISDDDIINALITQAEKGVVVRILLHQDSSNDKAINRLRELNNVFINVAIPSSTRGQGIMHNKFAVFDNERVITGSYNWSLAAAGHLENIVIIVDEAMAKKFTDKFLELIKKVALKQ